ncbi:MAG: hypothetical protein IID44_15870 [Planctomycetes bacterium]|nr:hypothetical protein [Planctomycetota bacterium]
MSKIRFTITLECQPDTVAPATRLKRLLKTALRRDRLRCIRCQELKPEEATK